VGWKLHDPNYGIVRPYGWKKGRGCHILVYHEKAPVVAGKRAPWTDLHVWIMDTSYQVKAPLVDASNRLAATAEIAKWRQRRVFFLGDGKYWPTNKSDVLTALKASGDVPFDAGISTEQLRESLKASMEELRRREAGEGPRWTIPTDLLRKRVKEDENLLRTREAADKAAAKNATHGRKPPMRPNASLIRKVNHQWTPEERSKVEGLEKDRRTDPDALVLLGDHHFLQCGGDQVGRLYEEALKLDPDHVCANLGMGEWHTLHRRYNDALTYLNRVLRLAEKDSPEAKHAEGVLEFARYYLDHGK
jgi:hypothetical protein